MKIKMQICDECSLEFCSTINYRRHLCLHRQNLNLDKDYAIKRKGQLQAFWDKLCQEEAIKTMSFDDVVLEGVSGSSIVKALATFIRKPGFSFPQSYVRSGSALLGRPSRFPISSKDLFSILKDASEETFLCAGKAESLQRNVFGEEAGKIGLEMRNLVAWAFVADKDAETLKKLILLNKIGDAAAENRNVHDERQIQLAKDFLNFLLKCKRIDIEEEILKSTSKFGKKVEKWQGGAVFSKMQSTSDLIVSYIKEVEDLKIQQQIKRVKCRGFTVKNAVVVKRLPRIDNQKRIWKKRAYLRNYEVYSRWNKLYFIIECLQLMFEIEYGYLLERAINLKVYPIRHMSDYNMVARVKRCGGKGMIRLHKDICPDDEEVIKNLTRKVVIRESLETLVCY